MCSALVAPALASAISERVQRRHRDIEQSIASYQRHIDEYRGQLDKVEKSVIELFVVKARLEASGFECKLWHWSDHLEVVVERSQLTAVYQVLGRLDGKNKSVDLVNARKKLVRITLTAVAYPFVSVSYQTKLPAGAPCRIEKTKTKARVEHRLVCSA